MVEKPDPKRQGFIETTKESKQWSSRGKPKISQPALFKNVMEKVRGSQILTANPDPFIQDLKALVPVVGHAQPEKLKQQVELLSARHMFVSQGMTMAQIANHLEIPRLNIAEWVEHYGWNEKKQLRMERRTYRIASIKKANEHVVETRTDAIFAKVMLVAEDLLNDHINDEVRLNASELKQIADTTKTSFEVRGAIRGSEKVGQKVQVQFSGEMQHHMVEMMKTIQEVPAPSLKAPPLEREILVQDAEFDVVEKDAE